MVRFVFICSNLALKLGFKITMLCIFPPSIMKLFMADPPLAEIHVFGDITLTAREQRVIVAGVVPKNPPSITNSAGGLLSISLLFVRKYKTPFSLMHPPTAIFDILEKSRIFV